MNKIVIAADLGGTNLRIAAINAGGDILQRGRRQTPRSNDSAAIVRAITELTFELREKLDGELKPAVFAAAVPGVLDSANGLVFHSPNLPELDGSDFSSKLSESLGLPVVLENDANAAAIGENWLGSSRGLSSSVCITLGTGVGGGIMIDGRILSGADGSAGEVGHICVQPDGPPCGCGGRGCLEQYSSASAIVRMSRELLAEYPDSSLANIESLSSAAVFSAGTAGDAMALEVFRRAGFYLGVVCASLINLLNPEAIVIGGGAAAGWDLFIGETMSQIKQRAFRRPAERVKIVRAVLGDDAGILGAARSAVNYLN